MTFPRGLPSTMQPSNIHDASWGALSAVYGGAIHPTAEGQAVMADAALPAARDVLGAFLKGARKSLCIYDMNIADGRMLKLLAERIKAGVNVNEAQPDGTRPIHWAVHNVDYDLVAALIARMVSSTGPEIFLSMIQYVVTVLLTLGVHALVTIPLSFATAILVSLLRPAPAEARRFVELERQLHLGVD